MKDYLDSSPLTEPNMSAVKWASANACRQAAATSEALWRLTQLWHAERNPDAKQLLQLSYNLLEVQLLNELVIVSRITLPFALDQYKEALAGKQE